MGTEGKLLVSRKNIVVSKDSIGIDKDLTKDRNLNTFKMYCKRRRSSPGSRTEKQEIVCMRVIALLAMLLNRLKDKKRVALEEDSLQELMAVCSNGASLKVWSHANVVKAITL